MASALFGVMLVASSAVAISHVTSVPSLPDGKVGICHATGSDEFPYLFLVVDANGADHGHHLDHEGDIVGVQLESECPQPVAAQTETAATSSVVEHDCAAETPVGASDVEAEEASSTELTESAAETPSVDAAAEESVVDLCSGNVGLQQSGMLEGSRLVFNFVVTSIGANEANDVKLESKLPDAGRAWTLAGPNRAACALDGRELECAFGDLAPQEIQSVSVWAPRCAEDCGEDIENEAHVSAFNDAELANNDASTLVVIPDCVAAPPPATPVVSPEANATEEDAVEDGNATTNESAPDAGNATDEENATAPEVPAAPEPSDLRVRVRSTQDDVAVVLSISVANLGSGNATTVELTDDLPDVRRPWHLGGTDADACTLEARHLVCSFGALEPDETRTVVLMAYTDRIACGHHLATTARVSADNDANLANNASTAGIEAPPC